MVAPMYKGGGALPVLIEEIRTVFLPLPLPGEGYSRPARLFCGNYFSGWENRPEHRQQFSPESFTLCLLKDQQPDGF